MVDTFNQIPLGTLAVPDITGLVHLAYPSWLDSEVACGYPWPHQLGSREHYWTDAMVDKTCWPCLTGLPE